MGDESRRYLVEILLRAREEVTQAAQRATTALSNVNKATAQGTEASKLATKADSERRSELERLHDAHVREKKDLDSSAAARRAEASGIRDQTTSLRKQLVEVRASQAENIHQARVLQDLASAREAATGKIDKEVNALNRQSARYARTADQNRRLADSINRSITSLDRQATTLDRDARSAENTSRSTQRLILNIDKQVESLRKSEAALSGVTAERQRAEKALSDNIRSTVRETDAVIKASQAERERVRFIHQTTEAYERFVSTLDDSTDKYDQNRSTLRRFASDFDRISRDFDTGSSSAQRFGAAAADARHRVADLGSEVDRTTSTGGGGGRVRRFFDDITGGSGRSSKSLRALNADFNGLQIALVIKYAQSLVSALVALAGTFISVASAAAQAGAALVGSFAAGAAQALPVIGLLVAAASRVTQVLKAVKLRNQEQLTASQDAQRAASAQRTASNQIASAEQSVADAHRASARAQEDLTQARKDAIRTVEDLIVAQRRAREEATQANLSLEQAQVHLQQAISTGAGAAEVAQAQLDVRTARSGRTQARTGVTRANQDVAALGGRGVEGTQQVIQSRRALADATRAERTAETGLVTARQDAADALANETSRANKLKDSLAQLSPIERRLFDSIVRLQDVYKRAVRPITDIIVGAFQRTVDRITSVISDSRILSAFKSLAGAVAQAIDRVTSFGTGRGNRNFIVDFVNEARRNLPTVVGIFEKLWIVVRRIALAAVPAFRLLLHYVDGYAIKAKDATTNTKGISDFFVQGVRYAKAFFDLGLAVVGLFLALAGPGGAATSGAKTIQDFTTRIRSATDYINSHAQDVRKFFDEARKGAERVIDVIVAIGAEAVRVFSSESINSFADFLTKVVIPAIGNTIQVMGALVTVFHEFLSLPFVSDVTQWLVTFLLLAKGLTIIKTAFIALRGIIVEFAGAFGLLDSAALAEGGFLAAITPVGWVVIALVALAALIVELNKKFHFLGPTFKFIKTAARDAFDFLKKAAGDVEKFFEDVWNKGLLKWLRYPFERFGKYLPEVIIFNFIKDHVRDVVDFVRTVWGEIGGILELPFKIFIKFQETVWGVISGLIKAGLDIVRGDFGSAGDAIAGVWESIFNGIYDTVTTILNAIIDGINFAIKGLNKISPFGDVDVLKHIPSRQQRAVDKALHTSQTNLGGSGHLAAGGVVRATPGGRRYDVGEAGYDEVVLTTDPKYKRRQQGLLAEYVRRAPHVMQFAQGGFVAQPGTNFTFGAEPQIVSALRKLSRILHETVYGISGYRSPAHSIEVGGFANDPHTRGAAADIGVGAPIRDTMRAVAEGVLRRAGLYRPYYPASAAEVNHVELIARAISSLRDDRAHGGVGYQQLAPPLRSITSKLVSANPLRTTKGALGRGLYGVYSNAKDIISALYNQVAGSGGTEGATAKGADADVVSAFRSAIRRTKASRVVQLALWEAGIVESGLKNLHFGDADSLGALQERTSIYGASHALDPLASALRFIRQAMAKLPWPGSSGALAQAVQVSAFPARYDAARGQALRYLARGGNVKAGETAVVGDAGPELLTNVDGVAKVTPLSKSAGAVSKLLSSLLSSIVGVTGGALSRFRVAFEKLAGDGGLLDQMADTAGSIADDLSARLQRLQFVIGPRGARRKQLGVSGTLAALGGRTALGLSNFDLQASEQARQGVLSLGVQRGALQQTAFGESQALATAQQELAIQQARGNKKGASQARSEVERLKKRVADTSKALAQNAQDLVEAQEAFQQSLVDAITGQADRQRSAIDRAQRRATAIGRSLDPADVIRGQIAVAQGEISALQRAQQQAAASGNSALVQSIQDSIDELAAQVDESVAQIFQTRVDAVNSVATSSLSANDRAQAFAQIGQTNYQALGNALQVRGGILATQKLGLEGLLGEAQATGNIDQIKTLSDSIADLDLSIAQNTQAIQDNTDANFDNTTATINARSDFQTGVLGSANSFFQTLSSITGQDTTQQQANVLGTQGGVLNTQRGGLLGQLGALLGPGYESLGNLQGSDLVNLLLSVSTGPLFDSIIARLDPTQQESFKSLVTALLSNAQATEQNTQQLQNLNGSSDQGFSSTAWQMFRNAIFTGSGDLLPRYQMTLPQAAEGARILSTGALVAHQNEIVVPARTAALGPVGRGDVYVEANVTTPTEVLDPIDVARQLAYELKNRGL